MALVTYHALVSGRVQGVFYRKSTQQEALANGVTGWAKNLPDGRVEVMLSGEAESVQAVLSWLSVGPERSRVTGVESEEVSYQAFEGFATY